MSVLDIWKKFRKNEVVNLPIGSIFYCASNIAPNGAFLLNGQIIYNCSTLYPEFYSYIENNNGIRKITSQTYESELTSTGICGGFVVDNSSIRLPNICNGFIQGSNGSDIGNTIDAGLPNITGYFNNGGSFYTYTGASGAFEVYGTTGTAQANTSGAAKYPNIKFDASKSSSVYGNSNTVQPKSVCYSVCIQVFNTTSIISNQQTNNLSSQIQSKVGVNADNFTSIGKNNIIDYTFDLATNNASILTFNTWYFASRSGFFEAVFNNTSSSIVNCWLKIAVQTVGDTVISSGGNIPGNSQLSYHLLVPKGFYYYIGCTNTAVVTLPRARFTPFKNSIAS